MIWLANIVIYKTRPLSFKTTIKEQNANIIVKCQVSYIFYGKT